MSRPKRQPHSHSPQDILNALKAGATLKELGKTDRWYPYAGRLTLHMVECGGDEFYESDKTTRRATNPTGVAEMRRGFATVRRWGLFRYDRKRRCWCRGYKPGETEKQFKARARKIIDTEFAILWIQADITRPGKPAPHSIMEFAAETNSGRRTVIRHIKNLVESGYIVGFNKSGCRSLWLRPDNSKIIVKLEKTHDRIGDDTTRQERSRQPATPTVDEVVAGLFNGSRVVAESFKTEILVCAGKLDLGGVSKAVLAARLGDLYTAMRREHVAGSATSGPLEFLRRYLDWLGDKDWPTMTTRVLSIDSPAFQQFRREQASYHPYGADPLTGGTLSKRLMTT